MHVALVHYRIVHAQNHDINDLSFTSQGISC